MLNLLITNGYPSEKNKYSNGFVHTRMKAYLEKGLKIKVLVFKKNIKTSITYNYEGVEVHVVDKKSLINILTNSDYENIIIHFARYLFMPTVLKYKNSNSKILIWVHGFEALSWKRRLFNIDFSIKSCLSFIYNIFTNNRQLKMMKHLIQYSSKYNIHFVFVSEWMKNTMLEDTKMQNMKISYSIIPNPIDTKIFKNECKGVEQRKKILSIRPYTSKKYANDITRDVILELSNKEYFYELEFTLIGQGPMFEKITKPLKKFPNVSIKEKFLNHEEIRREHEKHGVYLSPTRQDSQGVSMCEAICSGLVVVTSNNSAIPEFANDDYAYINDTIQDFVDSIEEITYNSNMFKIKNKNTVQLSKELDIENIISLEMSLINES